MNVNGSTGTEDILEVSDGSDQHFLLIGSSSDSRVRREDGTVFRVRRRHVTLVEEEWQPEDEGQKPVHHEGGPETLAAFLVDSPIGTRRRALMKAEEEDKASSVSVSEPGC